MKVFKKVKEIVSKSGDLHFQRFAILETNLFSIYIHKILKEDKDLHLHSHPWNFFTFILKGSYTEQTKYKWKTKVFLDWAYGNRNYFHKIYKINKGPVYTFFICWGKKQPWYYMVDNTKVVFSEYRQLKNKT